MSCTDRPNPLHTVKMVVWRMTSTVNSTAQLFQCPFLQFNPARLLLSSLCTAFYLADERKHCTIKVIAGRMVSTIICATHLFPGAFFLFHAGLFFCKLRVVSAFTANEGMRTALPNPKVCGFFLSSFGFLILMVAVQRLLKQRTPSAR